MPDQEAKKWTPEPWCIHDHWVRNADDEVIADCYFDELYDRPRKTGIMNSARIVACVNACASLEDPATFVADAVALLREVAASRGFYGDARAIIDRHGLATGGEAITTNEGKE